METKYASTTAVNARARQEASTIFLAKVFNWMAAGLALTGIVAWFTAKTSLTETIVSFGITGLLLLFAVELGLVVYLSARIEKMKAATATALFVLYATVNGLFMSIIFLMYTGTSIAATFMITAGMFGSMAVYGMVTKRDLSGLGSFLFMGLNGLFLAFGVNMFLQSGTLHLAMSGVGVLVFVGLTAYDVQRIKAMGEQGIMNQGESTVQKGAILGALALYLDFINLFIMLLSFFGGGRD